MNQLRKQKNRWHKKLLRFFDDNYIHRCEWPEGCLSNFALAPAHSLKQRFITTEEDYMRAALLCQEHHHYVEYGTKDEPGTHERMRDIIDGIISRRTL